MWYFSYNWKWLIIAVRLKEGFWEKINFGCALSRKKNRLEKEYLRYGVGTDTEQLNYERWLIGLYVFIFHWSRSIAFKMLMKWVFQNRENFEIQSHELFILNMYHMYIYIYKWNLNSGKKGDYSCRNIE